MIPREILECLELADIITAERYCTVLTIDIDHCYRKEMEMLCVPITSGQPVLDHRLYGYRIRWTHEPDAPVTLTIVPIKP